MDNLPFSSCGRIRLVHFTETDSTNAEALRRARAGEHGPLWIVADMQTHGRGRSGRRFISAPGNLHASLLMELGCSPREAQQLPLLAGVAVIEAITALAGRADKPAGLRLKWPNDIMIGRAKTGGILVECTAFEARLACVIGIGLNVAAQPPELGAAVTHLGAHGLALTPRAVFISVAAAMDRWLTVWQEGTGFGQVRSAWLAKAAARGERLRVNTGGGPVAGTFAGIDGGGALLINDANGVLRRFAFGDVTSE